MAAPTNQSEESASAEQHVAQLGGIAVAAANLRQHARSSLADFMAPAGSVDFWQPDAYGEVSAAEGRGVVAPGEGKGCARL